LKISYIQAKDRQGYIFSNFAVIPRFEQIGIASLQFD